MKKRESANTFYEAVVETETFSEDAYSGTFVATKHTVSPWSAKHQHAGPCVRAAGTGTRDALDPTGNALTNQLSVRFSRRFQPEPSR